MAAMTAAMPRKKGISMSLGYWYPSNPKVTNIPMRIVRRSLPAGIASNLCWAKNTTITPVAIPTNIPTIWILRTMISSKWLSERNYHSLKKETAVGSPMSPFHAKSNAIRVVLSTETFATNAIAASKSQIAVMTSIDISNVVTGLFMISSLGEIGAMPCSIVEVRGHYTRKYPMAKAMGLALCVQAGQFVL